MCHVTPWRNAFEGSAFPPQFISCGVFTIVLGYLLDWGFFSFFFLFPLSRSLRVINESLFARSTPVLLTFTICVRFGPSKVSTPLLCLVWPSPPSTIRESCRQFCSVSCQSLQSLDLSPAPFLFRIPALPENLLYLSHSDIYALFSISTTVVVINASDFF